MNIPHKILLVDDNSFNVFSLKLLIKEFFSIDCDCAYSGFEAIEMVNQRLNAGIDPYTLILTDINMP